ncbi:hypothetical protein GCM10027051_01850 [Niabella terrae]
MLKQPISFTLLALLLLTGSCGLQKRLTAAKATTATAKSLLAGENASLDKVSATAMSKLDSAHLDSNIAGNMKRVINVLHRDLNQISQVVEAVELFAKDKSNFNEKNYYPTTRNYIARLDSFNATVKTRERIYQLIKEAVHIDAFKRNELGTFFEPGAYRIPIKAMGTFEDAFQPTIDTITLIANQFSDIPRSIYLVLVGYADETPFNKEGPLYRELRSYLPDNQHPDRQQLNLLLSNLRARELERSMLMALTNNAEKFTDFNKLRVHHMGYGRGEEYPFSYIRNYNAQDERRRVVVFYWSILPDIH